MDKTDSDGEKEKACCERALALNRQSGLFSRTEKTKRRKKKQLVLDKAGEEGNLSAEEERRRKN